MLDRELKKGSAELLILSLVEDQPRHGYDLSKLIEARSEGVLKFRVASLHRLTLESALEAAGRWTEAPASAAAAITGSRRPAPASSRRSATPGASSSRRSTASRESNMPEWPRRISEEMRQHLDDEYATLRAGLDRSRREAIEAHGFAPDADELAVGIWGSGARS